MKITSPKLYITIYGIHSSVPVLRRLSRHNRAGVVNCQAELNTKKCSRANKCMKKSGLMIRLSFCSRSSVAVHPITCVYVKCLAQGGTSDQRQIRMIVKGKV